MLKNYFKIAIAVLRRRKFFTFISLFGICFTLTIVILVTSFSDHLVSAGYPDTRRDRELFVSFLRLQSDKGYRMSGQPSFYFFDHYVKSLKVPEKVAFCSIFIPTNTYVNNNKIVLNVKYTNDQYWDVLDYQFVEGRPYTKDQIDNAERVAVISADTREAYFGKGVQALGKYIETDNEKYRVTGVVANVVITKLFCYSDIYLPYTVSKGDLHNTSLSGNYFGILLAKNKDEVGAMRNEYDHMVTKIPKNEEYNHLYTYADDYLESFTRQLPLHEITTAGTTSFYLVVFGFFLLFLLLPTINLVNVNISRIMERSSEIGVRKAFGASSRTLVYQFIIENLILTIIGCLIGIALSFIILQLVNQAGLIANMRLSINGRVLFFSLVACLLFGLLSGVYPAWRMSRLQVAEALKAQ